MIAPLISLAEKRLVPDWAIRTGIRKLLSERLRSLSGEGNADQSQLIAKLQADELAVETQAANDQHYEVPAAFFQRVLGKRLKYSCGLFETPETTLDQAEEAMLDLTCQRAEIQNGQEILELGCGWGSLSLWMAEKYPQANITSVSNSNSQRAFIEGQAKSRGLSNVKVITCDMRAFQIDRTFDRIVSVEMFEHMRNYRQLFSAHCGLAKGEWSLVRPHLLPQELNLSFRNRRSEQLDGATFLYRRYNALGATVLGGSRRFSSPPAVER